MHKPNSSLCPYFTNRVMEILRICDQLKTVTDDLALISHVLGDDNPANLGTRGLVGVGDLGPRSTWQRGPKFLEAYYITWPRTEVGDVQAVKIPGEECRALFGTGTPPTQIAARNPVETMVSAVATNSKLGNTLEAIAVQALTREKLEVTFRVLARVLHAILSGDRMSCRESLSVKSVQVAVRLVIHSASSSAVTVLKEGKLRGLGAHVKDGCVWVAGRVRGKQLAILLGTTALPMVLASEPLAWGAMQKAHREDHRRGPRDMAARS